MAQLNLSCKLSTRIPRVIAPLLLWMVTSAMPVAAQIIDLANGQRISESTLIERLRERDLVLLGELHDNRAHHTARAQLIARIASDSTTVVSEHLPMDARVAPRIVNDATDVRGPLEAAGFDAKGWAWPLHEPLFGGILGSGLAVVGGNLPKGMSRQLATRGDDALPEPLVQSYRRSTLSPATLRLLDQDLVDGHCGQLPERYLPMMRLVQRATDVAMADALLQHSPAILVAGNGHVRKDVGVPQVLHAVAPQLAVASVAFLEHGSERPELLQSLSGRYDFVWLTEGAQRKDPCENFQLK